MKLAITQQNKITHVQTKQNADECFQMEASYSITITILTLHLYKTPWPESMSELYRLSDRCMLAKLVPTFAVRGCHIVSMTDLYGRILAFLDRTAFI
jgi:hypothetical protein